MEINEILQNQIVARLLAQRTNNVIDLTITLLEQLAIEISSIVGEEGFNTLYSRSIFLTQQTYPWLQAGSLLRMDGMRFNVLKQCLALQTPVHAREASSKLLIIFTTMLASLIGDDLTITLLDSAWNTHVIANKVREQACE